MALTSVAVQEHNYELQLKRWKEILPEQDQL